MVLDRKYVDSLIDQSNDRLVEEHYVGPSLWKAVRIPKQKDGVFLSLKSSKVSIIMLLPRHPEGHTLLFFYNRSSKREVSRQLRIFEK